MEWTAAERAAEKEAAEKEAAEKEAAEKEAALRSTKSEPPVLLLRLVSTEQATPVDLSFLSVFPEEAEWVFPLGVVMEQRKELKDTIETDGDKVECTTVELAPRIFKRK